MADVRTFRAASMEEALAIVRDELGQHAVVLHSRELTKRRLLPWLAPITQVEVTAGRGYGKSISRQHPEPLPIEATGHTEPRQALQADFGIESRFGSDDAGLDFGELELETIPPPATESIESPAEKLPVAEAARPASISDLESRLESIQQALASLSQNRLLSNTTDVPIELFELYSELLDAEVSEDLARELLQQLKRYVEPNRPIDLEYGRRLLPGMIESELRCQGPIQPVPPTRKVVALVGPTGVGKTTTLAKLAANFRLRDGIRMGLVTVDTYRIAAVEQLRTYAEIIDLPMKVVTTPAEMRRALDELSGLDLVLIDTAGRSPRDELKIQELKALLEEARVDEVHLVLSLTAGLKNLISTVRNFRAANVTSLILTKLDEAENLGSVLSLCREIELPISYLTTGQDVPDDIEPAVAARLARLILGRESLR